MTGGREDAPEAGDRGEGVSGPRLNEGPEAKSGELDPQIKAVIDELLEKGRARWVPGRRDPDGGDTG